MALASLVVGTGQHQAGPAAAETSTRARERCALGWSIVDSADVADGTDVMTLTAVDALSQVSGWAVGNRQPLAGGVYPVAKYWDGISWENVPTPFVGYTTALFDVEAISADDVWAVGTAVDSGGTTRTLTMHWNGDAWIIVPSPNTGSENTFVYSVAGVASDDVWAVGGSLATGSVAMHWDGYAWSLVPTANLPSAHTILGAVDARATDDVWAVGLAWNNATSLTVIQHWDGTDWKVVPSPSRPNVFNQLSGVAISSRNDIWAVGGSTDGNGGTVTLIERWDGKSWQIVPSPTTSAGTSYLRSVTAVGNRAWAVGYRLDQKQRALMLEWKGHEWTVVETESGSVGDHSSLLGLGRVPGSRDIWAVGDIGRTVNTNLTLTERLCRSSAR